MRIFYTGEVGGPALLAQMQEKGKLNNGREIEYASGLEIGKYRGLRTVEHAGGDAAYRTNILRFPDQRFSVVVLANAEDVNPTSLSFKIADIYLEDRLQPTPDKPSLGDMPEVTIDPKVLDAYVGDYELQDELRPGIIISFSKDKDRLVARATGQSSFPMYAVSNIAFRLRVVPAEVVPFDDPTEGGKILERYPPSGWRKPSYEAHPDHPAYGGAAQGLRGPILQRRTGCYV